MPSFKELLVYYIDHNFALIIISIGFMILYLNRNSRLRQHSKFLFSNIIITIILSFASMIEVNFDKIDTHYMILDVANYIGYALRPLIIYLMILAFKQKNIKSALLLAIPLLINWLVIGLNPVIHWMFSYDGNTFVRQYMGFTTHIVSAFYLGCLGYILYKLFKTDDKTEGVAALLMIIAVVIATVLETVQYAYDILNTTVAAAILFYYVFMFTFYKKRDTLTGLLDRHTFYIDYDIKLKHITAFIAMDLNGLKEINDRYGHKKGDEALIKTATIFDSEKDEHISFYRLGGDEFQAIVTGLNEVEVKQKIANMRLKFKEAHYNCSFGYAMKEKDDTVDSLLSKSDLAMYNDKREYYKNKNNVRSRSYKYTDNEANN